MVSHVLEGNVTEAYDKEAFLLFVRESSDMCDSNSMQTTPTELNQIWNTLFL